MLPRIESPVFELTIPSTKEKVKMRPMKVKEEKILLMAKEGNDPGEVLSAVKQVVQNCIVPYEADLPAIIVDNWAIFDIEYAFLQLRANSVSEEAEVSYIDNQEVDAAMVARDEKLDKLPEDQRRIRAQKDATRTFKIPLKSVTVKFPENLERQIKVNDKVGIHLRYPPASLYSDKEFLNATGDELVNILIQRSIETIYDGKNVTTIQGTNPNLKLGEWIDDLDVKTYNKIREFFTNLPHLEHTIEYKNKLGEDRKIVLTTLGDFFQF